MEEHAVGTGGLGPRTSGRGLIRWLPVLLAFLALLAPASVEAAPFPTTGVLDTFNRANGGLASATSSSGATWGAVTINSTMPSGLGVTGNQGSNSSASTDNNLYLTPTYGPDTELYADVPVVPTNGQLIGLLARGQQAPGVTADYYGLIYFHSTTGQATYSLRRYINTASTSLVDFAGPALAAGDGLGFRVTGTGATVTVEALRRSGSSWISVVKYADTSGSRITGAGVVGIEIDDSTTRIDNLSGGTVVPGPRTQFTNDANAAASASNPVAIISGQPHFSWINGTGSAVTKQRVQVLSDAVDENVVGLWHMDNDFTDSSGHANTLVPAGSPAALGFGTAQQGFGATANADGTDDRATVSSNIFELETVTVEAWVKSSGIVRNASNKDLAVVHGTSVNRNFALGISAPSSANATDGKAMCDVAVGGASQPTFVSTAARIDDGVWHHIACVIDDASNTQTIYVDGAAAGSRVNPGSVDIGTGQPLSIGAKPDGTDAFPGQIDDVRISNVARSAAEIAGYYKTGVPHGEVLWDSDPSDSGLAALASSCASAARCADVLYDSSGTTAARLQAGGRYFVRSKVEPTAGPWSVWSDADWFQMSASPLLAPSLLFSHNTNAQAGTANNAAITLGTPHFSLRNNAGSSVTSQRTQVLSDAVDSSVVALWHMDTATGATTDATGNGHGLTLVGGPTSPAGPANFAQALGLSGAGQYGTTPSTYDLRLPNDFTVDAWFATTTLANTAYPVLVARSWPSCGTGCNFQLSFDRATTKIVAMVTVGGVSQTVLRDATPYIDGTWHHTAMTVDSSNQMRLYVDGAQLGAAVAIGSTVDVGTGSLSIGGSPGGTDPFQGQIDDVRILSRALSAAEIAGYYASGRPHGGVMWDSDPTDAGIAQASCNTATRCADVTYGSTGSAATALTFNASRYHVRSKYETAGGVWSAWSTPDWFQTVLNTAPAATAALAQYRNDGSTPIASGGWTVDGTSNNVVLKFDVSDADGSQTLTPWVEVRTTAGSFGATCGQSVAGVTFSGTNVNAATGGSAYTATVNVTGLSSNTGYKWRACAVDQVGAVGAWTPKGSNPDFRVDTTAPVAPVSVADGTGTDVASSGSTTQLSGNWPAGTDTSGSGVASYDWCINETADCVTTIVSSGSVASPTTTFTKTGLALSAGTTYYVCARTVDAVGNTSGYVCSNGQTVMPVPNTLFTDNVNASAGSAHPTNIAALTPRFSLINSSGLTVNKQRTQVWSDIVDSSVVALWHLDTGSGVTADATGNGHTLAMTGGPTSPAGAPGFGQALGVDGVTQYAQAASSTAFDMPNDFTVSTWFNTTSIANATFPVLVQKANGGCLANTCNYSLEFSRASTTLNAKLGTGGAQQLVSTDATPLLDGAWHNATMSVDSANNLRLYVDGVQQGAALALGGPAVSTPNPVVIGATNPGAQRFQGSIDDVQILDRALTSAEIVGYFKTAQPHGTKMWDSDNTDAGVALTSCNTGVRCADITYAGPNLATVQGARWYTTAKYKSAGGTWSPWSTPDWFEVTPATISITADAPSVNLGSGLPGSDVTGTTVLTVTTNAAGGYSLSATDQDDAWAMRDASLNPLADHASLCTAPTTWTAGTSGGFGVTVLAATGGATSRLAKWGTGTGTAATDFVNNSYCGLELGTSATLHTRSGYFTGPDTVTVGYRMNAATGQTASTYSGVITYTATANL